MIKLRRAAAAAVFLAALAAALSLPAGGRALPRHSNDNSVSVRTETLSGDHRYLRASIHYPQLSGLADKSVAEAVNSVLKETAEKALAAGERNAAGMARAIRDGYTGAAGACETFCDYTVTYNKNSLISIVMTEYQYAGGAHGAMLQHGFTFDLAAGKQLRLCELMNGGAGWASVINATIRREIDSRAQSGILSEFEGRRFSDIGASPDFYLTKDALVIYFQQYAYFPYVAGIQEFRINYPSISGCMKDQYAFLHAK